MVLRCLVLSQVLQILESGSGAQVEAAQADGVCCKAVATRSRPRLAIVRFGTTKGRTSKAHLESVGQAQPALILANRELWCLETGSGERVSRRNHLTAMPRCSGEQLGAASGFSGLRTERDTTAGATAMDSATATVKQAPQAWLDEREADERRIHEKVEAFGDCASEQSPRSPRTGGRALAYRFEVDTIGGFVQQLAACYLARGYYFYVWGVVPDGKDPRRVDEKLVRKYGLEISKWTRARRKRAGLANVAYLRHRRFFVLLATHGEHPFFEEERGQVHDFRRRPLKFGGYAISHRGGHPHVRIEEQTAQDITAYVLEHAARRPAAWLGTLLGRLPFEPYAPVRRQLLQILRRANECRARAGLEPLPSSVLRLRRQIVRVFAR